MVMDIFTTRQYLNVGVVERELMYSYNDSEQNIGFDVDDTLILWRKPLEGEETIDIICPYDGRSSTFVIHKPHIKLLKDRKARGCSIKVWSQSGPKWAKAVVDALGLQDHVSHVEGKPFMIVDDLPASVWMPNNTYLKPDIGYGNNND